jgi:hypothetical protein
MGAVQRVGRVVERAYGASALTIACQVRLIHTCLSESELEMTPNL